MLIARRPADRRQLTALEQLVVADARVELVEHEEPGSGDAEQAGHKSWRSPGHCHVSSTLRRSSSAGDG